MGDLLAVGTRALLANQTALQVTGNNISNVNTVGYSRQSVVLEQVAGQFTGSGYIGKGVNVQTIQRAHNEFLTRAAAQTASVASMDAARATQMIKLEDIFPTGDTGLGSAVNAVLNSFQDVATSPSDLTARTATLAKADALTSRFRDASNQLDVLSNGVRQQLNDSIGAINSLAKRIASLNEQIARVQSTGQPPNDLLDQRDQLIQDLNGYVQTSTVAADDGTLGVFVGSQPLVLGTRTGTMAVGSDDFNDPTKFKLTINTSGLATPVDENTLGGGSVAGLLRFNNTDLADARNLLGRMSLAITTEVNAQHRLGVDLDGNAGGDFFTAQTLPQPLSALANTGGGTMGVAVADASAMVASDYEVRVGAGGAFTIIRQSDGVGTSYPGPMPVTQDGLTFSMAIGAAANGDRFIVKPFSAAAATMQTAFTSARALAVASPVEARTGTGNTGGVSVQGVQAGAANANLTATVTLTFTAAGTFNVAGTGTGNPTGVTYTSGQPISYNGWNLTLKGTPQPGDTVTVQLATSGYAQRDGGNATALMNLRDAATFDGDSMADGYAGLMSQIGIRSQSIQYAADVSSSIASTAATDKSSVAGVNLDEEAAKLLQFQQAYQASAKMIQIAQNIFDSLMQGLGN